MTTPNTVSEIKAARWRVFSISTALTLAISAAAAEMSFFERFAEARRIQHGFVWDANLVQTNNSGPTITNAAIPYTKFAGRGELAGIRLGMTMNEVVAAWGKPHLVFTYCIIGPRFWYGTGPFGDISLSFKENRLVLIAISGRLLQGVAFDNGLTGGMSRAECEDLLGAPVPLNRDDRAGLYVGDISYMRSGFRTDVRFDNFSHPQFADKTNRLYSIAVCLDREAVRTSNIGEVSLPSDGTRLPVTNSAGAAKP